MARGTHADMVTFDKPPLMRGTGLALKLAQLTSSLDHPFRFWFPYAFVPLKHARFKYVYLPVNRNYKPLGHRNRDWVVYDDYLHSHGVRFSSDPSTFKDIWSTKGDNGILYLYDDAPASRLDYFERLGLLNLKPMRVISFPKGNSALL